MQILGKVALKIEVKSGGAQGRKGGGGEGKPSPHKGSNHASKGRRISLYAYAHAADPEYSLRQSTLRQLSFETLFCRAYLIEIPWGGGPKGTQGDPMGLKGTQGDPKESKGTQGEGTQGGQGDPRAPSAPLGGNGAMGPFGVIPKPFRIESHFEWKVITNGKTF